MRIRNERTKVGKGNRKHVRNLFRAHGIEFPFHRKLDHNRYSFKIFPYHINGKDAEKKRDNLLRKMLQVSMSDLEGPDLQIVPTNCMCSYPRGQQFGIAVRFEDR